MPNPLLDGRQPGRPLCLAVRFLTRRAERGDLSVLRDVFRRSSLSNESDRANLLANPHALALSDAGVNEGRTRVATTADGRVVGFVTMIVSANFIEVEDLFVDPNWMRQGIGRELMLDVVATAQAHLVDRIEVTANPDALDFYDSSGFVVDREVDTQFGPGQRLHLHLDP
jgi:N-acetylglutamate synthase-like GNAT family acetyltransferase